MLNSTNIRELFKEDEFANLFNFFGYDTDSSEDELQDLAEMLNETYEHGCVSGACGPLIYYSGTKKFYQEFEYQVDEFIENLCAELGWEGFQQAMRLESYEIIGKTDCAINNYVWAYVEYLISKMIDIVDE